MPFTDRPFASQCKAIRSRSVSALVNEHKTCRALTRTSRPAPAISFPASPPDDLQFSKFSFSVFTKCFQMDGALDSGGKSVIKSHSIRLSGATADEEARREPAQAGRCDRPKVSKS